MKKLPFPNSNPQKLLILTLATTVFAILTLKANYLLAILPIQSVKASGPLIITFDSTPLFSEFNWLPGDSTTKTFTVENYLGFPINLYLSATDLKDSPKTPGLSHALSTVISQNPGPILYGTGSPTGPKHLSDLSQESPVSLLEINHNQTQNYRIFIQLNPQTGNDYQKSATRFNLLVAGEQGPPPIPQECRHLDITGSIVLGTPGNDLLKGTRFNDLIFGLEGSDKIYGKGGHDCLVGGPGSDKLFGGSGRDIILGGIGHDKITGGSGKDQLWGGPGNDTLQGGSDNDLIYGQAGNDSIKAGHGNDTASGGPGNDTLQGGSDNDSLYGNLGNDTLRGGSGNDQLIGGPGTDAADGQSGTDTCQAETQTHCEL